MLKGLTSTFRNNCNNIELTYKEYIVIEGQTIPVRAKLSDDCYENGNFIGSFILKTIQFETSNDVKFRNKEFEYYKVVDGESIKIGTFITTEIEDNDTTELVKVVGMDYGLKTQVQYTSALDYESGNVTLMDVWNECCELSGLKSGVDEFENSNFIVDSDQFTGTGATIRDVFIGIALSSGSFIKVMNDDKIYPIFKTHTETLLEDSINQSKTIENVLEIDKIKELKGDTQQDSYTGKNLYNTTENITKDGITVTGTTEKVVINGTATGSDNKIDIGVAVLPAGTYTITNEFLSGTGQLTGWIYQKGTWNRPVTNDISVDQSTKRKYATFTLTQTTQICYGFYYIKDRVYNNATIRLQIVKGSTPDYDYEPYVGGVPSPNPNYPQEIESVTGLQNVSIVGKNKISTDFFLKSQLGNIIEILKRSNNNFTYKNCWASTLVTYSDLIKFLKPSTTYTIKAKFKVIERPSTFGAYNHNTLLALYNGSNLVNLLQTINKNVGNLNKWYETSSTFTTPDNLNNYRILLYNFKDTDNNTVGKIEINELQIEEGSNATEYEPYKDNTYEVNLVKENVFNFDNYVTKSANVEIVSQTEDTLVATVNQATTWQTIRYNINNLKKNTDYSFKFDFENTYASDLYKHTWITIRGEDGNNIYNEVYYKDDIIKFNTGNSTTIGFLFHVTINSHAVVNTITINNVKLQENIELNKIDDYQDSIKKSTGKNLFDKSTIIEGKYIDSNGVIQNDPDNFIGDFIVIDNTKTYYVSANSSSAKRICYYDSNKEYISREVIVVRSSILTIPNNAKYVRLSCYNQDLNTLQLEIGTQQTSYEPYGKVWYIKKNIGKLVLNGSESSWAIGQGGWYSQSFTSLIKPSSKAISNKYLYTSSTWQGNYTFSINSSSFLAISDDRFPVRSDWINYLINNNIEIKYIMQTPTYEVITNQELINQLENIKLLKGENNITITSEYLTPTIDLTYWDDNSEIVEDYTELEDKRDTRPISCVRLGMSQIDGENVDMIDEDLVEEYGENWLILNDNPFAYNQEKRQQLITAIFNKVKGFGYSAFVSKTSFKPYMTCGDTLKFKNRNGDLVDSILLRYSHDYKEDDMEIQLEAPSETSATVNYVYPLSAIDMNKRTQIEVDKDKVQITNLTAQTTTMQDNLSNNYYTKDEANTLVQTAQTGLTNTFSEAGGNNIFRNTGLWFEQQDNVVKIGKNLFNKGTAQEGYSFNGNTGVLTEEEHNFVSDFIKVKKNTDYYVNKYISVVGGYDINKNYLSILKNNSTEGTFNSGNAEYIRVRAWWISNPQNDMQMYLNNAMLNIGTVGLPYEPYYEYTNNYEFWEGPVIKAKEEKASNYSALLLQKGTVSQEQLVPNGNYTVSFKYKKLVQLASVKCVINDIEIELDSLTDKEVIQILEVNAQHINIQFVSDTTNSCEIYDLMVNAGSVKLAYSQNQNETTTDTVNISKGITITSSDVDVTFKANADGIRTLDKYGNRKTEFTDTGLITARATIEDEAEIVGLLHKRVGNHVWVNKI